MNPAAAQTAALVQIDFKRRHVPKLVSDRRGNKVPGLYELAGAFWERPKVSGKRTWRRLKATTIERALLERSDRRIKQAGALIGNGIDLDPYRKIAAAPTVAALCDFYVESGCPKKKSSETPRNKQGLREEKTRVQWLKKWWGTITAQKAEPGDCLQYHKWRLAQMELARVDPVTGQIRKARGKGGDRQVEKEHVTLSQIFWWAVQNSKKTGLKQNPLAHDRPKFRKAALVVHCRDFQPASGDELHAIARMFFEVFRSQVLGWQVLLEAMIGARSSHLLRLRWDAKDKTEAGYIKKTKLGRILYLYDDKTGSSKGTNEFIEIHPALAKCLEALKAWRDKNYPDSPWFFPSEPRRHKSNAIPGSQPLGPSALTHGLARITPAMGLPKRTSHGLRSFFVNVHRSRGMPDAKIALLIGHKSGGKLIIEVYGSVPDEELSWMPSKDHKPAWSKFEPASRPATPKILTAGETYYHQPELFDPIQLALPLW